MGVLYSKLRLLVPSVADGKNAVITNERGGTRTVEMSAPITDVMVAGMEKYNVQAGTGSESKSVGFGQMKKIVTEDASALAVATMPTKTTYLVGENLDLTGAVVNATIQKGDGTSLTRNVTSLATYNPANGVQLNTQGTQSVNVEYGDVSSFFDISVVVRSILKKLPYKFNGGRAIVYNNEIHILGGDTGQDNEGYKHYKWNGSSWVSVSTLPYSFAYGSAVVYNNEIHILGGSNNNQKHYKWNGSSWSSVSTLPYNFYKGDAVVYNNEIHILGSDSDSTQAKKHYKWNGSSWSSVSTLREDFRGGRAVVYNNEIHILGGAYYTNHYKWNGSSWLWVSNLPYNFYLGGVVVYNNEIHILGSTITTYSEQTKHYKWNGSSWSSVSTLPYNFANGDAVVCNSGAGNEIYIIGSGVNEYKKHDAQWNGTSWTVGSD